jgi:outer membrane protein TolC
VRDVGTSAVRLAAACLVSVACVIDAAGQSLAVPPPFQGSVPSGDVTAEPLSLSFSDAVTRGLEHNLGVLAQEQGVRRAHGDRWEALSDLLPRVDGSVTETRQVINLAAFGFTGVQGLPSVVGPFNVFDARVSLSQPVFDLHALHGLHAQSHAVAAARHQLQDARELVVLAVTNLYLEAVTGASRLEAARAQLQTAEALYRQATDLKAGGLVAGIDVVRAQVEQSTERQRVIAAENDLAKQKLQLARAIGLPLAQTFTLADRISEAAAVPTSVEEALTRARTSRPDLRAAQQRVEAAESTRRAEAAAAYPAVHVDANYGSLGLTPDTARPTFLVSGAVTLSLFDGERRAKVLRADAELQQRRDELADLTGRVEYDVRAGVLDVHSAGEQLEVARSGMALAAQELTQARDRFGAGVADTIEVVRAQEAVAAANERYFESLYRHGLAKVTLARAMGLDVDGMKAMFGGTP